MKKRMGLSSRCNFMVPLALALALAGTAGAGGTFDGAYKGRQSMLPGSRPGCTSYNTTIIIKNNHFNRRWGDATLSIDVAGDGTFNGEATFISYRRPLVVSINGGIIGEKLEADMGDSNCKTHLSLTKS